MCNVHERLAATMRILIMPILWSGMVWAKIACGAGTFCALPGCNLLGVVDGMPIEPVFVADSTDVSHGTGSDAGGQTTVIPNDARTKTNHATKNAAGEGARGGPAPAARMTPEETEARAKCRGCQGNPRRPVQKGTEARSAKECLLTGTRSLQP